MDAVPGTTRSPAKGSSPWSAPCPGFPEVGGGSKGLGVGSAKPSTEPGTKRKRRRGSSGTLGGRRAAIYLRVSSAEQAEDGYGLATQRQACKEYVDRLGYSLHRIHQDSVSGRDDERPAFQYLMMLASRRAFDVLVVWKRDRYFRNSLEAGFWEAKLKQWGVRIESVQQGPQDDTPGARFSNRIIDAVAELERETIAERCGLGRRMAAQAGEWPTRAPFGYTKDQGHLVLHQDQAAIVREAYRECLRGANLHRIGHVLSLTPSQASRRLRNPLYKGEPTYAGIRLPAPAIVSPEAWQEAQEALDRRRSNRGQRGGVPFSHRHPWAFERPGATPSEASTTGSA